MARHHRRGSEAVADRGVTRNHRLRGVERLRADFASMVDAHQAGGMAPFVRRKFGFRQRGARNRPRGMRQSRKRAQRAVEADDQGIEHRAMVSAPAGERKKRAGRNKIAGEKTGARGRPLPEQIP